MSELQPEVKMGQPLAPSESKVSYTHQENSHSSNSFPVGEIPVSHFVDHGFLATLRLFKKTAMICVLSLFIACSDGYQYTTPGNLVAQTSFIREYSLITAILLQIHLTQPNFTLQRSSGPSKRKRRPVLL